MRRIWFCHNTDWYEIQLHSNRLSTVASREDIRSLCVQDVCTGRIQRVVTCLCSMHGAVKCDELLRFIAIHARLICPLHTTIHHASVSLSSPNLTVRISPPAPVVFLDFKHFLVTPGIRRYCVCVCVCMSRVPWRRPSVRLAFSASVYLQLVTSRLTAIHRNLTPMHWSSWINPSIDTWIIPRRRRLIAVCPDTDATLRRTCYYTGDGREGEHTAQKDWASEQSLMSHLTHNGSFRRLTQKEIVVQPSHITSVDVTLDSIPYIGRDTWSRS